MKQWTLWDLVPRIGRRERITQARLVVSDVAPALRPRPAARPAAKPRAAAPRPGSMVEQYDLMVRECLAEHGVRVRRWRTAMTGVAWEVTYTDGSISRLIEAPRPRGPMSAAVFLHEIGHHAIGFHRYKPRCLEEHMAWAWALAEMERRDLNITEAVLRRVRGSMRYAICKATRRGMKRMPREMLQYLTPSEQQRLCAAA